MISNRYEKVGSVFRFCPSCGGGSLRADGPRHVLCSLCGLDLFLNPAIAVGAVVVHEDQILLLKRAKDPGKGLYGLPGGFVDEGETAESALRREMREEVNLVPTACRYLCSLPNQYRFNGIEYAVLDFFYVCDVESMAPLTALDEVEACELVPLDQIDLARIAFPSVRKALDLYLASRA